MKARIISLIVSTLTVCGAMRTTAAIETQTVGISGFQFNVLNFNQFDPSLGTLNDIVVTFNLGISGYQSLNNSTSLPQDIPDGWAYVYNVGTASAPGNIGIILPVSSLISGGVANPGQNTFYTTSDGAANGSQHVSSADFGLYSGSGTYSAGVSFNYPYVWGWGGAAPLPDGVQWWGEGGGGRSGSIEIDYFYNAVPEPGTYAAGFAALGYAVFLSGRKRRL